MKKIIKGREPKEWTAYCATPGVDYTPIPELRKSLMIEQGYICAYCLRRITLNDETRIEHIKPRCRHQNLKLKYNNMVLCCNGMINSDSHCDVRKGDQEITFNLFTDAFFSTLSYSSSSGNIKSSNNQWDSEINDILNLNNKLLKANRKKTLEATIDCISNWSTNKLRQIRQEWAERDALGQFRPYCSIVLWYIDKKLNQIVHN